MKGKWLLLCSFWFFASAPTPAFMSSLSIPYGDYLVQRSRIIAEESHNSLGGNLEFECGERAANDVLMAAKHEEVDIGFQDSHRFLPARNFLTVTEEIRRSKTFQIIERMPKGGALHVHDYAMLRPQFLYEATFRENLYICRQEGRKIITFRFLRSPGEDTHCTSSAGWELLTDLRANASIVEDLNEMIRSDMPNMTLSNATAIHPADVDDGWAYVMNRPSSLWSLLSYLPVHEDMFYQALTEFHNDNVSYIEFRSTLRTLYDLDGNVYGPREVLRLIKTTTDRFVTDHPDFIGAKLIYTVSKSNTKEQMDEQLLLVASLKKEFPEFVVGFDLVGQEDRRHSLIYYAEKLRSISPDIRLFLHAGETKWSGITDENLIDAVLLNATRIGHGYALTKHPTIMKIVKERGIAIEVNPISNQVLNLVADMRNHPASFLFSRDFPVVVSSDDPGMWGAVGLSYDFYESFVGIMSRSADIRALKQLAMNSIKYSAMSDEEKARAYKIWKAKWTTFVKDLGKTTGIVPGNSSDNSCLPKRNNASSITSLTNILHVATLLFAYVLIRS